MSRLRLHQVLAFVVLLAAAAWVLTGKFSHIGSERADAEEAPAPQGADATEPPRRTVLVAEPETVRYSRSIRVAGRTEPDKTSVLAARDSGIIRALPAVDGQSVSTGTVILSLDGPEKLAAVETAQALLAQRQAQANAAESLLARGEGAKIAADIARAELAAAEAQLREAEAAVERLDVVAPFAGTMDDVAVERGSWVQAGTAVATILALNPVVVRGEVSERDLANVRVGTPATVNLTSGAAVEGRVRYVRPQASPQTRTFQVEVEIPNRGGNIPAGMSAEILLHADPVSAVVVPRSVVTLNADGALGVRTVVDGDEVAFVPVAVIDDTAEGLVVDGVPEGAKVVISGQDLVVDGETVNAVMAASVDAATGSQAPPAGAGAATNR
jgi:multidrug efflux system membrane fusion protein